MVRSLMLGLVMAMGAALQGLPAARAQTPLFAQVPAPSATGQPSKNLSPLVPPPTKAPFGVIFQTPTPPQDPDVLLRLKELVAARTEVSCGLTMVQVDPNIDPRIRRELPPATGQKPNMIRQPDFKVRRITPTICRE